MGAALLRPIFNAGDRGGARELAGAALERLRKPLPKVAALLEEAEADLLAFYSFPLMHWPKPRRLVNRNSPGFLRAAFK